MTTPQQTPKKFDLVAKSVILRGEKPTKGMDAVLAANENQMNRLTAYLPDGTRAVIAQRPGKGGMDFNKLLGGKVYAVAADSLSPVFEKGEDKKPTKVQKVEDGLPLYSSSGFYQLSSKEHFALHMTEAYTKLLSDGEKVLMLTEEQLQAKQTLTLTDDMEWDMLQEAMASALSDANNLVSQFDAAVNKKRSRIIEMAIRDAEDAEETYTGKEFRELTVQQRDGNPFLLYAWKVEEGPVQSGTILREYAGTNDNDRPAVFYDADGAAAVARFVDSEDGKQIAAAIDAGKQVSFSYAQGHLMRTSVQFKRKVANEKASGTRKQYGDAVYIWAALESWVKGVVAVMHSMHPNFPADDYPAHYYVAACRQAEIGMQKLGENKWAPPAAITYDLAAKLL